VGDEWAISFNAPGIKNKNTLKCKLNGYLRYDILVPLKYKSKHILEIEDIISPGI
jgi:hypothetical protein